MENDSRAEAPVRVNGALLSQECVRQCHLNKEVYMSKFLMQISLTQDGVRGLAKDGGTKRRQAAEQFFKSAGGKLEALYFAFGDTDVFAIVDFPDNASAAAISLAGNGAGQANVKATVLISAEEMDQAAQKSQGLRPPGA
jgi:uncharacterized protein with GYD domain